MNDPAVRSLLPIYADYQLQDMALKFRGITPTLFGALNTDALQQISDFTEAALAGRTPKETTEFYIRVAQLAERAITSGAADPQSPETFIALAKTPSDIQEKITEYVWTMSRFYKDINTLITNSILPDATKANTEITTALQADECLLKAGGVLEQFDWGILADPRTLQILLNYGIDTYKIFIPDQPVVMYYYQVALTNAKSHALIVAVPEDADETYRGLIAACIGETTTSAADIARLENILLVGGTLDAEIAFFDDRRANTLNLVADTLRFSNDLSLVTRFGEFLADQGAVPQDLLDRVNTVQKALIEVLLAIEVLREIDYNETLILWAVPDASGVYQVIINGDLVTGLQQAGLEPQELISVGRYLHIPESDEFPRWGYTLDWYIKNYASIIASVTESEESHADDVRRQITQNGFRIIRDVLSAYVASYARASGQTLDDGVLIKMVEDVVVSATGDAPLVEKITFLLAIAAGSAEALQVLTYTAQLGAAGSADPVAAAYMKSFIETVARDVTVPAE